MNSYDILWRECLRWMHIGYRLQILSHEKLTEDILTEWYVESKKYILSIVDNSDFDWETFINRFNFEIENFLHPISIRDNKKQIILDMIDNVTYFKCRICGSIIVGSKNDLCLHCNELNPGIEQYSMNYRFYDIKNSSKGIKEIMSLAKKVSVINY